MRYWGYFLYSDIVTPDDIRDDDLTPRVYVQRLMDNHRVTYRGARAGDMFIFYPGDDRHHVRRDGELIPGTELYTLVMTDLMLGKAVAVTL